MPTLSFQYKQHVLLPSLYTWAIKQQAMALSGWTGHLFLVVYNQLPTVLIIFVAVTSYKWCNLLDFFAQWVDGPLWYRESYKENDQISSKFENQFNLVIRLIWTNRSRIIQHSSVWIIPLDFKDGQNRLEFRICPCSLQQYRLVKYGYMASWLWETVHWSHSLGRSFNGREGLKQWFPTCGPRAKSGSPGLKKWPSTS